MKLTPKMQEVLDLLDQGYRVTASEYHGRFGTTPASAFKCLPDGTRHRPKVTQGTIDALIARKPSRSRAVTDTTNPMSLNSNAKATRI